MKYLITVLFSFSISYLYSQDSPLIQAFREQNFVCHNVKYFSELKNKVDSKKSNIDEVFYLVKNHQILGFLCSEDFGEPSFFISNKKSFTLFLSEGIDNATSIYESVLKNSYSMYNVEIKKKRITYIILQWKYPNWEVSSSRIWKFRKKSVEEFGVNLANIIKPLELNDSLLYDNKIDILKGGRFENMKFVGVKNNDSNLRPSVLVFLLDLIKKF